MSEIPEGLQEWVEFAAPQLGLDAAVVPVNELLGMTGVIAHSVVRPAAPISAYLLGLAVGSGAITSYEAGDALLRELAKAWEANA
ncbi:MAG: DUF6457 domain-containing protein [Gulosibacter sp.]|uniref:DUF6457 domain-containing protein n=1 Tax=Gulosibacter sp. TaxID=2817531 RepID=UPI003F8E4E82